MNLVAVPSWQRGTNKSRRGVQQVGSFLPTSAFQLLYCTPLDLEVRTVISVPLLKVDESDV
jgi:hypothetical protein